jgi:hypothetical protein
LKQVPVQLALSDAARAKIRVLVDEQGKVIDAKWADAAGPSEVLNAAHSMKLDRSRGRGVRSDLYAIEFRNDAQGWLPVDSYAGVGLRGGDR